MSRMIQIRHGEFGRIAILDLEGTLVEHAHSHSHLLFWLDGAPSFIDVSGERVPFDDQHAVAIDNWEPHAVSSIKPGERSLYLLMYLRQDWVQRKCTEFGVAPKFHSPSFAFNNRLHYLVNNFARILLDDLEELDLSFFVDEIFQQSMEEMQGQSTEYALDLSGKSCSDFRIRKSVEYMKNNLDIRRSFDEVARTSGLSRPHFFSLFRRHMNMTPSVFWNTLRMECAIDRLIGTDVSLSELADELGFTEPGNFSRFFRNHSGVCPSQYRLVASDNVLAH